MNRGTHHLIFCFTGVFWSVFNVTAPDDHLLNIKLLTAICQALLNMIAPSQIINNKTQIKTTRFVLLTIIAMINPIIYTKNSNNNMMIEVGLTNTIFKQTEVIDPTKPTITVAGMKITVGYEIDLILMFLLAPL
ncbi:MAG: hypothetical protein MJ195_03030 [Mycoplasmoidaceae bacterium]|nr:hypothetical protein [Mycoplasmoidaceae bacterium]